MKALEDIAKRMGGGKCPSALWRGNVSGRYSVAAVAFWNEYKGCPRTISRPDHSSGK